MTTAEFLAEMRTKCEAKATKLAALELSVWDGKHENELKENFGFDEKTLKERKRNLIKKIS